MRWQAGLWIGLALVIGVGAGFWSSQRNTADSAGEVEASEDESATVCVVSDAYKEAVDENILNARRLFEESTLPDSSLNSADTAALFYSQITSSRRYHEAQHRTLPDCALPFNHEYTAMLAGLQDILALKLAAITNRGSARQQSLIAQAQTNLNAQWERMSVALNEANLTSEFEFEEAQIDSDA